jgi:hypothetical protein
MFDACGEVGKVGRSMAMPRPTASVSLSATPLKTLGAGTEFGPIEVTSTSALHGFQSDQNSLFSFEISLFLCRNSLFGCVGNWPQKVQFHCAYEPSEAQRCAKITKFPVLFPVSREL